MSLVSPLGLFNKGFNFVQQRLVRIFRSHHHQTDLDIIAARKRNVQCVESLHQPHTLLPAGALGGEALQRIERVFKHALAPLVHVQPHVFVALKHVQSIEFNLFPQRIEGFHFVLQFIGLLQISNEASA